MSKAVYINGIGTISPQVTFGDVPFLETPKEITGNRLTCIEPEYTGWIDPKAIRRMSRVIRMGVASAAMALKEAGLDKPDAIITGTAFGCLEDTGIFLTKMIENNEHALNPTPFIQSTHNTIGSQVALLLQCQGYNQTYSHRAFSFEHSLLDALMMLEEKSLSVLVGGVDEVTDHSFSIMNRFGLYKDESKIDGIIQGEGASYFLLSGEKGNNTYARIINLATLYKPIDVIEIQKWIKTFLTNQSLNANDVDLILLGSNGDVAKDSVYSEVISSVFSNATHGVFKHLCGEYQTSNAFAMWTAAKILKDGKIPSTILKHGASQNPKRILIYNQHLGSHHSLILLESC
ncbi:MAG TPA: beta-ketoacyl synthase chain length factor [Cyclobacteriaceae bacterium]